VYRARETARQQLFHRLDRECDPRPFGPIADDCPNWSWLEHDDGPLIFRDWFY
jgi:hypothetical protein